uniref:Uncharacterized protein n=1 Tax=Euplotes harpa TaxID=151035 RepID=A0A7S3JB08_9SPIT|mmetsp:Transcript_30337/g.34747  ORF Transcript_30337/g.34747 Transcript_30337/m.34747 type:complete len:239 (+) Transcript_30337:134-850(+)
MERTVSTDSVKLSKRNSVVYSSQKAKEFFRRSTICIPRSQSEAERNQMKMVSLVDRSLDIQLNEAIILLRICKETYESNLSGLISSECTATIGHHHLQKHSVKQPERSCDPEYDRLTRLLAKETQKTKLVQERHANMAVEVKLMTKYLNILRSKISTICTALSTNQSLRHKISKKDRRLRSNAEDRTPNTLFRKIKESAHKRSQFKQISYAIKNQYKSHTDENFSTLTVPEINLTSLT